MWTPIPTIVYVLRIALKNQDASCDECFFQVPHQFVWYITTVLGNCEASWQKNFVTIIDGFYSSNEPTWSKSNINVLLEREELKDIRRSRACYQTTKRDSSVIHRFWEEFINYDRLLEEEFDDNSIRGELYKNS